LQIFETKYGKDHTETGVSYAHLGSLLQEMGELEEAKKYYLLALQINETKYGKDHTSTAFSYGCLGSLLQDMGELEEAKKYLMLALHIRQSKHGKDHTNTRQTLLNLFVLDTCLDQLPSFISSNQHAHCQLILITKYYSYRRCKVCKLKSSRMYSCSEHQFDLCLKCALDQHEEKNSQPTSPLIGLDSQSNS
jgi:tetratricopeptide (TPR) repeat protein